jgi:hypothetical protein
MTSDPDKRHTELLNNLMELGLHPHSGSDTKQADVNIDRTAARQDTAKWKARERVASSESDAIDPKTGLMRLRLVEAANSRVRAHEYIMTKEGSPWRSYKRIYQLRLRVGDRVNVAERKSTPFDIVTVKRFSAPRIKDKLYMLQRIRHPNFVLAFNGFMFKQSLYIVFKHMPISLQHIAGNLYINELRLASILRQVSVDRANKHRTGANCSRCLRALPILQQKD